jgi:shikimate kinase
MQNSISEKKTLNTKTIVLIGLMGSGKSSIGSRLAKKLSLPFKDADDEIIASAKLSVAEIFKVYGEYEFRKLEERVIKRLLMGSKHVLATGGGAYMNEKTRNLIKQKGISVWLRADIETLLERTSRREGRPLLDNGNPKKVLKSLISKRHPIYSNADIIVDTGVQPHGEMVKKIVTAYDAIKG